MGLLVVLPSSGRRVIVNCVYTSGWGGNFENPPEPTEIEDVTFGVDADTNVELSQTEIQALFDNDGDYSAMVEELDKMDCGPDDDNYADSMDGDHDSAMASAGFGTDEDYGCYSGND